LNYYSGIGMVELSKAKEDVIKNDCPSGLDLHPDFVALPEAGVSDTRTVAVTGYRQDVFCRTKSNLGYIIDTEATSVPNNLFCQHNSVTAQMND
jgi:hypothetical protein